MTGVEPTVAERSRTTWIPPAQPSRLVPALRTTVLAIGAVLWAWPMTSALGLIAAFAGALAGCAAAHHGLRLRLRIPAALALAAAAAGLGSALSRALVQLSLPGWVLGPVAVLYLRELTLWFSLAAGAAAALRSLTLRRRAFVLLEILFSAVAFVVLLSPHRQGLVNRPLVIGDWAWTRGWDPTTVLLWLGVLGALGLCAALLTDRGRRVWLHLLVVFGLGASLLFTVANVTGLPRSQIGDELGLTGEAQEVDVEPGDGDGAARPEEAELNENDFPFRDDYSSDGGEAPVAVVLLHDDYTPVSAVYYFRQSALSQFNGNRLVQATRSDADRDLLSHFPSRREHLPELPGDDLRRELRTSVGLLVDHVRPFALDSPESFAPLSNPNSMQFVRVFEALSRIQYTTIPQRLGRAGGSSEWSAELREHYLRHPDDPRYRELARSTIGEQLRDEYRDDPLALALSIKAYLDENGIYSLKSKHAGAADPTASFLFGDLTGYCVHFAHAAVYMLRSLGIPSRVGVGYAVPESDRGQSGSILIRALNAHAWPEIYLDGLGWTVVDLAPAQALDGVPAPTDQSLQTMLGDMLRGQTLAEEQYLEAQRSLPTLAEVLRALAALTLALYALGLAVKAYRAWLPSLASERSQYRLLYRAALDRLAEVGARRRFGETREDFAARISPLAPSFAALTHQHLGWAFGSRRLARRADLRELGVRMRDELRRSIPPWRRALGIVHPFPWLSAR